MLYSKISETVKYRDRMLFLLAYSHYPYKCICVKKIIFIFTGSDRIPVVGRVYKAFHTQSFLLLDREYKIWTENQIQCIMETVFLIAFLKLNSSFLLFLSRHPSKTSELLCYLLFLPRASSVLRLDQYFVIYIHTNASKSSVLQIMPYFANRYDWLLSLCKRT